MVLFPEGSALGFIRDCRGADPPVYPETRAGQSHSGLRDPHLSRDSHGGGSSKHTVLETEGTSQQGCSVALRAWTQRLPILPLSLLVPKRGRLAGYLL